MKSWRSFAPELLPRRQLFIPPRLSARGKGKPRGTTCEDYMKKRHKNRKNRQETAQFPTHEVLLNIDRNDIQKTGAANMPSKKTKTYEEFVDKFKVKKTTDDCYTPENIYEVVANYVADTYKLDRAKFVRPFYPGGDYEHYDYHDGDIVVDNPPFSIMAQIIHFYAARNIPFFLFANGLTIFSSAASSLCMNICTGITLEYENTAKACTSFVTNLEECGVRSDPKLYAALNEANKINVARLHKSVPKYSYPRNVLTAHDVIQMSKYGVDFKVSGRNFVKISCLDSQRKDKKQIFGKGLLLNNAAAAAATAAAAAAAAAAAVRKQPDYVWELSDRERDVIAELDSAAGETVSDKETNRYEVL